MDVLAYLLMMICVLFTAVTVFAVVFLFKYVKEEFIDDIIDGIIDNKVIQWKKKCDELEADRNEWRHRFWKFGIHPDKADQIVRATPDELRTNANGNLEINIKVEIKPEGK